MHFVSHENLLVHPLIPPVSSQHELTIDAPTFLLRAKVLTALCADLALYRRSPWYCTCWDPTIGMICEVKSSAFFIMIAWYFQTKTYN